MPVTNNATRYATDKQVAFLRKLLNERQCPAEAAERLDKDLIRHRDATQDSDLITFAKADASIKWFLKPGNAPMKVASEVLSVWPHRDATPATVGVYRKDESIYIVLESTKNAGHTYAKKLVVSPPRMTEAGEEVDFEYIRAPGMVYSLTEADRMTDYDLRDFLIKYRKCIKCGKSLFAAKTLQRAEELGRMVGKRCAQKLGLV